MNTLNAKTSLKMITRDTVKYVGLVVGIAFATFLMAQQVSTFIHILRSTANQVRDIKGPDIWVMSPGVRHAHDHIALSDIQLYKVRGVEGVQWAVPLYQGREVISMKGQKKTKRAIIIGVDDATHIGQSPIVTGSMKTSNGVVMDAVGWNMIWPNQKFEYGREIIMGNKHFKITGLCNSLTPFETLPIVFMPYTKVKEMFSGKRKTLSFILVKAKTQYKLQDVIKNIQDKTGLKALTRQDFENATMQYYVKNTGPPINFCITIVLGFIIGILISALTFYIFINENLKYFATLKAIGLSNLKILQMVLIQAFFVGILGFCLGAGVEALAAKCVSNVPILRDSMLEFSAFYLVAIAIFITMTLSSFLSIRRVFVLDPATVFQV